MNIDCLKRIPKRKTLHLQDIDILPLKLLSCLHRITNAFCTIKRVQKSIEALLSICDDKNDKIDVSSQSA